MSGAYKPSAAALRILRNIEAGRWTFYGLPPGRSQSGGATGTIRALRRHGLLDGDDELTFAGRVALDKARTVNPEGGR